MAETVATAKELARDYMEANIPFFMEGPPGVGKSDGVRQLAAEKGIGFIDVRLGQLDPVDLRGLPMVNNGATTWARPDFWPDEKRDGEKGIILFDELADCGKAMQSAAYQIILDGRAGPHIIPKGWYRAAAGNRRGDRAAAQSISTALASRFAWIEIEADHKCFLAYGNKMGFHHYVMGFIQFRPGLLHDMKDTDQRAFPCPRQWERVSRICDAPDTRRQRLVAGLVGQGAASEFGVYLRGLELPSLDEILANPTKCKIPQEPSSKYALSSMLSRYADTENFAKIMAYAKREEYGRDFEISTVMDATQRDSELCNSKAFIEFANRNKSLHL